MMRDEILAMEAGTALNTRISKDVMGNQVVEDEILGITEIHITEKGETVYGPLPPYSEDMAFAELVIIKMKALGYVEAQLWKNEERPEVVCRAALLTLLDKKKETEKAEMKSKFHIVK